MFVLDAPSDISYKQPSWLGGYQFIAGGLSQVSDAIFSTTKAIVDPVKKEAIQLEQSGVSIIKGGVEKAYSAAGDALGSIAGGLRSTIEPFLTPIKWALFFIVLGLGVYTFLIASPYLPKPGGK